MPRFSPRGPVGPRRRPASPAPASASANATATTATATRPPSSASPAIREARSSRWGWSARQAKEERLALSRREGEALADGGVAALAQHQLVAARGDHDALRQRGAAVGAAVDEDVGAGQVAAHLDLCELALQADEVALDLGPARGRLARAAQVAAKVLQRLPLLAPGQVGDAAGVTVGGLVMHRLRLR